MAKRIGKLQALVAIEHSILVAVWNMITTGSYYTELGFDYYTKRNPERTERNAIRQLQSLGYEVTLKRTA